MEGIAARVSTIKGDEIHGAAFLTEEALNILGDAASDCPGDSGWEPCVSEVARALASAKPSVAGLRNATGRLLDRLVELGPLEGSRLAETLAEELVADLRKGAEAAAANAARLLPPGAVLATCSYSSAGSRPVKWCKSASSC